MISDGKLESQAQVLLERCRQQGLRLATAESCTGGLVAGVLTAIPGSSDVFERGWVTYSNLAKEQELGVSPSLLELHGAVSEQVARAMAEGALVGSPADISGAVTGIAGPGGQTPGKPVGLVWIASARRGGNTLIRECRFSGDRGEIRRQSVAATLQIMAEQSAK